MLSINIWELLWTIINFFLLYFLLRNLLYKPLIKFMDARQARIDAGLDAEKKAQDALTGGKALINDEKNKCRQEAKSILERAKAAFEAKKAQLIKRAREQTAHNRQELKKSVSDIGSEEQARFEANERELAELLLGKLLSTESGIAD